MGLVLRTLSEVSAVMDAVSVCDPDRTAAADRRPLPCVGEAWGRALARAGKLPPHHPAHPRLRAVADRFAPDPGSSPHDQQRSIAGTSAPEYREAITTAEKVANKWQT